MCVNCCLFGWVFQGVQGKRIRGHPVNVMHDADGVEIYELEPSRIELNTSGRKLMWHNSSVRVGSRVVPIPAVPVHFERSKRDDFALSMVAAMAKGDRETVQQVKRKALPFITQLEEALLRSSVLAGFEFNPDKPEANPSFTPEEEQYARGGMFELL